ncbi:GNAT family N-acetyltransferase [Woodsholea maritima]|uniref:GNAT family N-acetyltransferase n=1 Tax=Woodsholea maritima TaxID=240237 RepID=UPI0003A2908C|nr:GNAT family N-acetyltransferase [Woodsholea maritima]
MTDSSTQRSSLPRLTGSAIPEAMQAQWMAIKSRAQGLMASQALEVVYDQHAQDMGVLYCFEHAPALAVLGPDLAPAFQSRELCKPIQDVAGFRAAVIELGYAFHGEDYLFGYDDEDAKRLCEDGDVRTLNATDQGVFEAFEAQCSEDDLDQGFVVLDHWMVRGLFIQGQLVSIASAYPDGDGKIADIGVITHPDARGKGYGARLVRAIAQAITAKGYVPQYRCQLDHIASIGLARAAGLSRIGTLDFILDLKG